MYNLITGAERPSRTTSDLSDKEYSLQFGRYSISSGFDYIRENWIAQYITNVEFFFGNQWINEEDLEAFLKDDSNQSRNRIKVKKNMVLPTVSQYVGNAISMDMNVRCRAISPKAINRRELKLEELLFVTDIANSSNPNIREEFRKRFGIGETPEETQRMFSNLWQDNYVKTMNMLMEYISEINDFAEKRRVISFYLALSGLATMKYTPYNGEMRWDVVPPQRFFYDHTAEKPDLSDAEFMGEYEYMAIPSICELYNEAINYKKELESAVKMASVSYAVKQNGYIKDGKIPIYKSYWLDSEPYTYGYVYDQFGYPYFTRINYVEEGAEKPRYTNKDVIPYKDLNESQKKKVSKDGTARKYYDVIRYIIFIPREVLSGNAVGQYEDIVLEYGIMPYQDTEYYRFASAKFPYKNYTWYYHNGFIFTPVSELINPQRMINRLESVKENLVNSSLPKALAYDKSMLDSEEGEEGMLRNLYQGKPIALNARNMGVQNAITSTGSTMDVNSISAYDMMGESMRMAMDRIIGVNDSMKGQSQGSEQLVGVTALQIQRASLIQEPFYDAIAKVFEQAYQASSNVGKRIYADNERDLVVAVGDGNAEIVKLTKEYNNEDFRVFVHREPNAEQQKAVANQQLLQFIQLGLIDKAILSDMWNRSTPDDIAEALRKSAMNDIEVAIRQQRMQQEQMAQQQQVEQQAFAEQIMDKQQERQDMLADKQRDREVKHSMKETEVMGKIAVAEMNNAMQRQNQVPQKTVNTK